MIMEATSGCSASRLRHAIEGPWPCKDCLQFFWWECAWPARCFAMLNSPGFARLVYASDSSTHFRGYFFTAAPDPMSLSNYLSFFSWVEYPMPWVARSLAACLHAYLSQFERGEGEQVAAMFSASRGRKEPAKF